MMKKLLALTAFGLLSTVGAQAQIADAGGPDAYGYTWQTSAAVGGPTYHWVDITTRGTLVTDLGDDNTSSATVILPFSFPFYLHSFSQLRIGSNGYVTFDRTTTVSQPFPALPTPIASGGNTHHRALIAPYLADLKLDGDPAFPSVPNVGRCYYYVNADSAVISFIDVPFWVNNPQQPDFRGSNTFQVILSRADASITFQYQDMDPAPPTPSTGSPNQTVIGVQDATMTLGLQAGLNQIPANGLAVKIARPANGGNSGIIYHDMGVNWIDNPSGAAFFGMLGQPLPITANLRNYGNQRSPTFNAWARVTRPQSVAIISRDTVAVPSVAAFHDSTIAFPSVVMTDTGAYSLVVGTLLPNDMYAPNNLLRAFFTVVDTAHRPNFRLTYDRNTPDQVVPFGAGVYFRPPFYPAEMEATDAFVVTTGIPGTPAGTAMRVKIYADNGPQGQPGSLLYDGTIAQNALTTGATNRLVLPSGIRINSGGFYVSWVPQQLTNTFIGAHRVQDDLITSRSYEVINDVFAPYRNVNDNVAIGATLRTRPANVTGVSHEYTSQASFRSVFPNPATERATINYSLKQSQPVSLTVTDLLGRPVRTLGLGQPAAGDHQLELPVAGLPAGLYVCALRIGSTTLTQKLLVQH